MESTNGRLDNLERFGEELQEIFGLLKCRGDKEAILTYADEHKEYFQHMDRETGLMVGELLQSESIVKKMMSGGEKGDEMDMCKALEDLYNDGVERGERQKLKELVGKKLKKGHTVDEIADMLEESIEIIRELVSELKNDEN